MNEAASEAADTRRRAEAKIMGWYGLTWYYKYPRRRERDNATTPLARTPATVSLTPRNITRSKRSNGGAP